MYNDDKLNFNIKFILDKCRVPMESNLWIYHKKDDDEELLLANVEALRNQLRKTERNLQNLGEELSRYVCI